jgi:TolB-like protein
MTVEGSSEGNGRNSPSGVKTPFDDDAKNPRFIQTIPRRGYRLIAPVTQQAPDLKPQASVAVLAFADMSAEKDQEYFCDGIAEEIINNLAHLKGLRVAARTSAFAFKGKPEDVRLSGEAVAAD